MSIEDDRLKEFICNNPVPARLLENLREAPVVEGTIDHTSRHVGEDLSPSELICVQFASHGLTNSEIADVKSWPVETVKSAMKSCMRKLQAKNRTHAVARALRRGLIE